MNEAAEKSLDALPGRAVHGAHVPRFWSRIDTDVPQLVIASIALVLFIAVPELTSNIYWSGVSKLTALFAIASIFMSVLFVDAGQTSFGHGAVFGVSAYAVGMACGLHDFGFGAGLVFGLVAAVAVGVLFALPALRVQGFYLGFVTLSAAIVLPEMLLTFDHYTSAVTGIVVSFAFAREGIFGISWLAWTIIAVGIAAVAFQVWLRRTRLGRRMRVAAASVEAAQSLGISPGAMRSIAFIMASVGTGIAGALYPPTVGFVSPSAFDIDLSILFFFALIVGGRGQPLGPIVGLVLLYLVPNVFLAQLAEYRLLIYGCIALIVMLLMPNGAVGTFEAWRRRRVPPAGSPNLPFDRIVERLAKAPAAGDGAAIEIGGATKSFGHVVALDKIDLQVRRGEIHGLVGANGSGKTTLLNILSGFNRLDAGTVRVGDVEIGGMPAHRIARLGLGRSFQTPRIIGDLSVWENVEIGLDTNQRAASAGTEEIVAGMRAALGDRGVETVPHGQRRLLEMMRIVLRGADVLLLDEPAAGLSPDERRAFAELLKTLRTKLGKTIVLVEHDLELVWGIADRITVLEAGRIVASGLPGDVARNPAVGHLFLEKKHA